MSSPATLVGFVPEPNCGRGTVGILWSCATAIFLCSWTMLHGGLKSKKRKLRLLAFMLIFPEGIACQEIQTFINARRLQREVRKHSGWEKLTLRQAFLLELGGIHFSPGIDNTTAKTIVALQAAYFASAMLFRLAHRMPISLFEVLTAGCVLCGLVIGLACLKQPKDFREPFEADLLDEGPAELEPSDQWAEGKRRRITWGKGYRLTWPWPWLVVPMVALFTAIHLAA